MPVFKNPDECQPNLHVLSSIVEKNIDQLYEEALSAAETASDIDTINTLSTRYLGRKGLITLFLRNISSLPEDERPMAGKRANEVKQLLSTIFKEKEQDIAQKAFESDSGIDVSLPGRAPGVGRLHPVSQITREICDIFTRLGFEIAEGPEVETDYFNFEALNFPPNHPARDMQDTFFVSDELLLRTHTSPMQVRVMTEKKPPLRLIAPGKVYRCDSDITHTPMFHQVEGLMVDENISFGDLKGILTVFIHQMFDEETSLRFRPSFFPFTEPSAEVDIRCVICKGKGCRVCSQSGWLEILGAGMVHPNVFKNVDYDTRKFTGFAFGTGVERIAMLKYGINDLRKFYENDLRFLGQF